LTAADELKKFMHFINIEIKARCFHPEKVEAFLFTHNA